MFFLNTSWQNEESGKVEGFSFHLFRTKKIFSESQFHSLITDLSFSKFACINWKLCIFVSPQSTRYILPCQSSHRDLHPLH
jgi:hypothetical protein